MKVRLPKSWDRLPESEKEIIAKVKEEEINSHFAELQKNWLMMSCIVLNKFMGKDLDDCLFYLANFKSVYRLNAQKQTREEQQEWLKAQMDDIFGVDKFPYKYLDSLEDM